MAEYKVIQDIEAEDKLLGPLTLKGFIYALIAGTLAFLNFKLVATPAIGSIRWALLVIFGLPMLLFGVLASPLGREQPTEIWLLSRIRFFIKPKSRVWDQSGLNHLVTITAPKKVDKHLTKELSQNEVKSRLKTLAVTMDSRGWAVKNVNVNLNPVPGYLEDAEEGKSDRLVGASSIPQTTPAVDVQASDDILDEQHNPVAQKFHSLMQHKDNERKKEMVHKVNTAAKTKKEPVKHPKRKMGKPAINTPDNEIELNKSLAEAEASFYAEHPNITTQASIATTTQPKTGTGQQKTAAVTDNTRADKLELAQSGNDLSVASIEKLANRQPRVDQVGPNEVVISLH
ncbi:MAG TPA: PrgI family protein [Candidatus Saccharimonadales bacterium]|nr:PrgI family protein [Candidatus Saccharimonadales bacterium]